MKMKIYCILYIQSYVQYFYNLFKYSLYKYNIYRNIIKK